LEKLVAAGLICHARQALMAGVQYRALMRSVRPGGVGYDAAEVGARKCFIINAKRRLQLVLREVLV
jgi:hypothetical protein